MWKDLLNMTQKPIKGNTVKYDIINKSKASECQNASLVKLKDK